MEQFKYFMNKIYNINNGEVEIKNGEIVQKINDYIRHFTLLKEITERLKKENEKVLFAYSYGKYKNSIMNWFHIILEEKDYYFEIYFYLELDNLAIVERYIRKYGKNMDNLYTQTQLEEKNPHLSGIKEKIEPYQKLLAILKEEVLKLPKYRLKMLFKRMESTKQ